MDHVFPNHPFFRGPPLHTRAVLWSVTRGNFFSSFALDFFFVCGLWRGRKLGTGRIGVLTLIESRINRGRSLFEGFCLDTDIFGGKRRIRSKTIIKNMVGFSLLVLFREQGWALYALRFASSPYRRRHYDRTEPAKRRQKCSVMAPVVSVYICHPRLHQSRTTKAQVGGALNVLGWFTMVLSLHRPYP